MAEQPNLTLNKPSIPSVELPKLPSVESILPTEVNSKLPIVDKTPDDTLAADAAALQSSDPDAIIEQRMSIADSVKPVTAGDVSDAQDLESQYIEYNKSK